MLGNVAETRSRQVRHSVSLVLNPHVLERPDQVDPAVDLGELASRFL